MNKIKIFARMIYVACPAGLRTGGPELLHQLVFTLNKLGKKADIVYYKTDEWNQTIVTEYQQYISNYLLEKDVVDCEENLIIVPETNVKFLSKFKKIQKAIWWLSVDNFFKVYDLNKEAMKYYSEYRLVFLKKRVKFFLKKTFNKKCIWGIDDVKKMNINFNLCQSYYALDFCQRHGLKNILYLSDYINDYFLSPQILDVKEDIILYNPKKGFKFTKKILACGTEFNFIPLINMSRDDICNMMRKAKIYMDFGNHPGKDRMPREACMLGCVVITGLRGSANFNQDVCIPSEYKFGDFNKNVKNIVQKIQFVLKNYDINYANMHQYKMMIEEEKNQFLKNVEDIFVKRNEDE